MGAYDRKQIGDATEFSTTPEEVPWPIGMVAIPGALLVLIAFAESILLGLVAAGFVYGAMYLLKHSKNATLHRTPANFKVSKAGVEVGGKTIPAAEIHRVIVGNHVFKSVENIIVVADPNINSGQNNTVTGMNWMLVKVGPIAYRVDVEARGVPTTLAGGLTEATASAIAMDVNKILGL